VDTEALAARCVIAVKPSPGFERNSGTAHGRCRPGSHRRTADTQITLENVPGPDGTSRDRGEEQLSPSGAGDLEPLDLQLGALAEQVRATDETGGEGVRRLE
jgi:hypothetical protein